MLLEQFPQHAASLVPRALQGIDARQVQIRLIKRRSDTNALFKTRNGIVPPLRRQIKDPRLFSASGYTGRSLQSPLQIIVSLRVVGSFAQTSCPGCSSPQRLVADLERSIE